MIVHDTATNRTLRRRRLDAVAPPPRITDASEFRLLLAWIDSVLECPADQRAADARYESALRAEEARLQARLSSAERYLPAETPAELRALFGQPRAVQSLLGWWDGDQFTTGLAALTEREAEALMLLLVPIADVDDAGGVWYRPPEPWEIARDMGYGSRRQRRNGMPLAVETVDRYLRDGRWKLRRLFGA